VRTLSEWHCQQNRYNSWIIPSRLCHCRDLIKTSILEIALVSHRIVTVFGGSGFIGRHLVQRLARQGAVVRVAVRDTEQALFLKPLGNVGQVVPVYADVTDPVSVAAAVAGADQVVNLVGILAEKGKQTFERIHVEGAANIAAAAARAGVGKLVQMSALGADAKAASRYAKTKANGEQAARDAFANVSVVRPGVVMGADDGFFNLFAGISRFSMILPVFGCPVIPKIILFGPDGPVDFEFYGDGGTRLQPVFVGDVAGAITAILDDPDGVGQTYELGGPRSYSFKQVMELLLQEIGRARLLVPVPFAVASFMAWFLEKMPSPLLTRDQVTLLKSDTVVSGDFPGFRELGITPASAESVLPAYLHRFRPPARRSLRQS